MGFLCWAVCWPKKNPRNLKRVGISILMGNQQEIKCQMGAFAGRLSGLGVFLRGYLDLKEEMNERVLVSIFFDSSYFHFFFSIIAEK